MANPCHPIDRVHQFTPLINEHTSTSLFQTQYWKIVRHYRLSIMGKKTGEKIFKCHCNYCRPHCISRVHFPSLIRFRYEFNEVEHIFDMKWKSICCHISNWNYWNKRLHRPKIERMRAKQSNTVKTQDCIQFNECNFTISTNNHKIFGSLFVDRVFVLRFHCRFMHDFLKALFIQLLKRWQNWEQQ